MQEIEIKANLKHRAKAIEKLAALGCTLSEPIHQADVVYVENLGSKDVFLSNKVFLRIRVNNGSEVIFTAKRRTGALVAIEHEVTVNSREELEQMILLMGYHKAVEVKKIRYTTHYNSCEICIDEVEGLGAFIEMENMSQGGDAEAIQEELFQFFETLGISRDDRVTKGYDLLMLEKLGTS